MNWRNIHNAATQDDRHEITLMIVSRVLAQRNRISQTARVIMLSITTSLGLVLALAFTLAAITPWSLLIIPSYLIYVFYSIFSISINTTRTVIN